MACVSAPASAAPRKAMCSARSDCEPSRNEPPIPSTLTADAGPTPSRLAPPLKWRTTIWNRDVRHSYPEMLLASTVKAPTETKRRKTMSIPLRIQVLAAGARLLYSLPEPVRRLIAGRPIRIDGEELALDAQL